ncbi:hypothetical protein KEM54_004391, partial [Ascosphaera aggregata]
TSVLTISTCVPTVTYSTITIGVNPTSQPGGGEGGFGTVPAPSASSGGSWGTGAAGPSGTGGNVPTAPTGPPVPHSNMATGKKASFNLIFAAGIAAFLA